MADLKQLMRVRPDDQEYLRQAAAEAAFWGEVQQYGLESLEQTLEESPTDLYNNECFTGNQRVHWYDTLSRFNGARRGLILGTSSLNIEAGVLRAVPSLHATFADISPGALERRAEALGARFPGRVSTMVADMNFLELEESGYDLIVSCASVHHVTNLEYLAYQINRALTPDGHFVLQDYAGEPQFLFDDVKKRVFEVIYERDMARSGISRPFNWATADDLSPFCGIRSDETLGVMRAYLEEEELRIAGTLLVPIMRVRPVESAWAFSIEKKPFLAGLRRRLGLNAKATQLIGEQFLNELGLVGEVLAEAGLIKPGNAFAIYGKRSSPGQAASV